MRITLLIALIITVLSKNFGDIYKTEKQIQKETLNKCILNSDELRKDMKEIYGDIQKALINHHYLDILRKLEDYNPRNNKILFQCYNAILDEEDDIVLERGSSSHSSGRSSSSGRSNSSGRSSSSGRSRSSPTKSNPTRSSPTKSSPTKSSPTRSSPTRTNPTKSSSTRSSPTKSSPTKSSPSKSSPTRTNPTKSSPTRSNPTKKTPINTNVKGKNTKNN